MIKDNKEHEEWLAKEKAKDRSVISWSQNEEQPYEERLPIGEVFWNAIVKWAGFDTIIFFTQGDEEQGDFIFWEKRRIEKDLERCIADLDATYDKIGGGGMLYRGAIRDELIEKGFQELLRESKGRILECWRERYCSTDVNNCLNIIYKKVYNWDTN